MWQSNCLSLLLYVLVLWIGLLIMQSSPAENDRQFKRKLKLQPALNLFHGPSRNPDSTDQSLTFRESVVSLLETREEHMTHIKTDVDD